MINKKIFMLTIFLIALLSISVVSAEDSIDDVVSVDDSADSVSSVEEVVDSVSVDDSGDSVITTEDSIDESVITTEDSIDTTVMDESIEMEEDNAISESDPVSDEEKNIDSTDYEDMETYDSGGVDLDDIVIDKNPKTTLQSSYEDDAYNAYINPVTTYYVSGKYVYLGWDGYFSGYFRVYRGRSCVHNEYIYGYDKRLQWSTDNLDAGTFTARLISDNSRVLANARIVVRKATTRVSVKSFSTRAGTRFHCYAYVYDRRDGTNINGGYVYFRIAGRTYKARLKDGVASFYFRAPKKVKRYVCTAYYHSGKNIQGSATRFVMVVKKPIKYKTLTLKTRLNKSIYKKWRNYKAETYVFKSPYIKTICVFLYKNGRMVNGKYYYSKVHYKYGGRWYWTKWGNDNVAATYHKRTADPGITIGDIKVRFRVS